MDGRIHCDAFPRAEIHGMSRQSDAFHFGKRIFTEDREAMRIVHFYFARGHIGALKREGVRNLFCTGNFLCLIMFYFLEINDVRLTQDIIIEERMNDGIGIFPEMNVKRHYAYHFGKNTDRKSTRLNSSHQIISYAVFCLKKKITNYSKQLK